MLLKLILDFIGQKSQKELCLILNTKINFCLQKNNDM